MHIAEKGLISTRFDADGIHVPDVFKDKVRMFLKDAGIPVLKSTGDYADNVYALIWMRMFCIPTEQQLREYFASPSMFKYFGYYHQPEGMAEDDMLLEFPDFKQHTLLANVRDIIASPKILAEWLVYAVHGMMMDARLAIPLPMTVVHDAPDHSVVTVELDELYLVRLQHYNENLPIDHVQPGYKLDLLLGHPVRSSVFHIDLH